MPSAKHAEEYDIWTALKQLVRCACSCMRAVDGGTVCQMVLKFCEGVILFELFRMDPRTHQISYNSKMYHLQIAEIAEIPQVSH